MKNFLKKIVLFIITFEARLVLKRYKPGIIAITGSVGKTSTKQAIETVLREHFRVRKTPSGCKSEIGVPLAILGLKSGGKNIFLWFLNILTGLGVIVFESHYPDWLILELSVERPKDMAKMASWLNPKIVVITSLGEIPPHIEFFAGPEALAKEKSKILRKLGLEDFAILNYDDSTVYNLKEKTKAKIITFGFGEGADLLASNYQLLLRREESLVIPEGITFKVDYKGSCVPVRIFGTFGKQQVYSALAALAVGSILGINLVELSEMLAFYNSPAGRLKLIEGVKGSFILDDSYNSSPLSLRAAIEVLKEMPAKRKIAVLGDMLELGKYTIEAHRSMADYLFDSADKVFLVGPRAKFIAEALVEKGFDKTNIFEFSTSEESKKEVEKIIQKGDLILVKGSRLMKMEKIVEEIMAHPERKNELLIQEKIYY